MWIAAACQAEPQIFQKEASSPGTHLPSPGCSIPAGPLTQPTASVCLTRFPRWSSTNLCWAHPPALSSGQGHSFSNPGPKPHFLLQAAFPDSPSPLQLFLLLSSGSADCQGSIPACLGQKTLPRARKLKVTPGRRSRASPLGSCAVLGKFLHFPELSLPSLQMTSVSTSQDCGRLQGKWFYELCTHYILLRLRYPAITK